MEVYVEGKKVDLIRVGRRGHVVLPQHALKTSGLEEGALFTLRVEEGAIIVTPVEIVNLRPKTPVFKQEKAHGSWQGQEESNPQ